MFKKYVKKTRVLLCTLTLTLTVLFLVLSALLAYYVWNRTGVTQEKVSAIVVDKEIRESIAFIGKDVYYEVTVMQYNNGTKFRGVVKRKVFTALEKGDIVDVVYYTKPDGFNTLKEIRPVEE